MKRKPTKAPKDAPTKKAPKAKAKAPRVALPKVGTRWTTEGRTWKLVKTNPTARDPYERATLELLKPTKLDLDYKIGHRMTVEPAWFAQPGRSEVGKAPRTGAGSPRAGTVRAKLLRELFTHLFRSWQSVTDEDLPTPNFEKSQLEPGASHLAMQTRTGWIFVSLLERPGKRWGSAISYQPKPDSSNRVTQSGADSVISIEEAFASALRELPRHYIGTAKGGRSPDTVKKSSRKTKARAKLSRLLKKKKTKKAPAKAKAAPAKATRASVPKALSLDSGPEKLALGAPKTVAKIFRDTFAKLRTQRKDAITFIRLRAKAGLAATRKRFAEKRVDLVAKLKEIQRNELLRLAQRKDAELKLAKDVYESGTARTKAIKRATAEHRAHLKAMKARHSVSMGRVVAARRASEKRGENLDRVRQNIEREHPEMLAYFDKVKSKLKQTAKMSRTEHFYQLAHDNPGEVILASERLGDRRLRDSLKNEEKTWENRAKRMEAQLCKRAHRDFMRSRPFRLKVSERRALEKLGVDPEGLEVACYRPARRIVSGRGASARKTDVPF